MGFKKAMISQFGRPRGIGGVFVGWIMSKSNKPLSDWTFEKINARSNDFILEVGYGTGNTIEKIAQKIHDGLIAGIDHSELMYRVATKRNRRYCEDKKAVLQYGTIDDMIYPQRYFDAIYGNNVHFFWPKPEREFLKLRSYLKPNGKLLMVFQPRWIKSMVDLEKIANETRLQFVLAGFTKITVEFRQMKAIPAVAITGYNQ